MSNIKDLLNTIIQGDCLEVLKTFPDKSVDLIFADEPYKISDKGKFEIKEKSYKRVNVEWDKAIIDRIWVDECARILKDGGAFYATGTFHNIFSLRDRFESNSSLTFRNFITWFKPNAMPFKFACLIGLYAYSCEYVLYYTKGKTKTFNYHELVNMNNGNQMRDLWIIKTRQDTKTGHPTQKPEALLSRIIQANSNKGDVVLDPFMGSGTTAIEAKRLGRHFIGIELNPEYVKIANKRLNFEMLDFEEKDADT